VKAAATASPASANGVSTGTKLGVTLAPLPTAQQGQPLPKGMPSHGVLVSDVTPLGASYQKLFQGDIVTEVLYPAPRRQINSAADLQSVLASLKPGDYVSLTVYAQDASGTMVSRVVNVRLGS
jgi:S1-C subfamily serine protease